MRVQDFADAANGMEDGLQRLAAREVRRAFGDDAIPKVVADALVERTVADYGKAARVRGDEHERGVAGIVAMQSGACELVLCAIESVDGAIRNHANRNASGRAVFGGGDGARDGGALVAGHGLKFTAGAVCAPGCDWKYGFSLKRLPKIPAYNTVGNVSRFVLNARASSLYFFRS